MQEQSWSFALFTQSSERPALPVMLYGSNILCNYSVPFLMVKALPWFAEASFDSYAEVTA